MEITRGHNNTLVKKQSRLDVRKFSFSQRILNVWNYQLTVYMLVVLIIMFKNMIYSDLVKAGYT